MGIAGEVAKRLSFGSVPSASGGKRRVEPKEGEEDEGVKRQRVGLGDSIFGRPRLSNPATELPARGTPRKSLAPEFPSSSTKGTPRKSLAQAQQSPVRTATTPRKSIAIAGNSTPAYANTKSPRRSLFPAIVQAERDLEAEAELVDADPREEQDKVAEMEMETEERREDFRAPAIGLASFLQMAGVEFVDTLPSMGRRKSGWGLGEGVRGKSRFTLLHGYTPSLLFGPFLDEG
jgi:hypothetical protein